jgi:serine/threonine protein kinase
MWQSAPSPILHSRPLAQGCCCCCCCRLCLLRYTEVVGKGRFKQIYKAFDTQIGIDVAWSKISAEPHHLSDEQLQNIVSEMTKGLDLEHPNIIKCFECWEDEKGHCINLITELFTSGNLRQYRNLHKHLDLKVRSGAQQLWARACLTCDGADGILALCECLTGWQLLFIMWLA